MSIQGMRNWFKGHRNAILVVFVLLVVGLIGTYASSGLSGMGNNQEVTPEQKLKVYETQIADARTALEAAPEGFTEVSSLAGLLFESAALWLETEDKDKANAAFTEAAELFAKSLEVAPENLNATGKIRIMISMAGCHWMLEDNTKAEKIYKEALELDNKDYNANVSYAQFLVFTDRLQDAKVHLTVYKSLMSPEDPNLTVIDGLLTNVKDMIAEREANPPTDDTKTDGETAKGEEQETK